MSLKLKMNKYLYFSLLIIYNYVSKKIKIMNKKQQKCPY